MIENAGHDLSLFFNPESIAVVGVSTKKTFTFGGMSFVTRLIESGYKGRLYPINPNAEAFLGIKAYPDLASLPEVPDLAIVCLQAPHVPSVLEDCARAGIKHIHILSAGFRETGDPERIAIEEQVVLIAAKEGLLIMGPNCMGPYSPSCGLTAWGAIPGRDGILGIISQSGAITQRLSEIADSMGIGVHKAASIGNAAVLDTVDLLDFMARDDGIEVIAMYLEGVGDGRRLLRSVKEANRRKPVVVLIGGESEAGRNTATSHTGSMAGSRVMWEAFVGQTGATRVRTPDEWIDAVMAFVCLPAPAGKGVFIMGGGGGNSVLAADICVREGLDVPTLSQECMDALNRIVPKAGSFAGNPLDLWQTYQDADCMNSVLETVYEEENIHMIVADRLIPRKSYHMPDHEDPNPAVIEYVKKNGHRKPTVFTIDSDGGDVELASAGARMKAMFGNGGLAIYANPARAVRALKHLVRYYSWKRG